VVARDTGGAIGGAHIDVYRPPPAEPATGAALREQAMLVVPPGTRPRVEPRCP
jgi:3D domain-containing protein